MKCFERLVMTPSSQTPWTHSKSLTAPTKPQMSQSQLHFTLPSPTWTRGKITVRMLFIDYSSAFNTIVASKLGTLGLNTSLYNWILDFQKGRPQVVRQQHHCHADPQQRDPTGVCA
jgi:hypothetical protein